MAKVRGIVIGTGGFSRCRIGSMVSMNRAPPVLRALWNPVTILEGDGDEP